MHFVPVRPDFGHNQNKPYDQRVKEGQTWSQEVKLVGPLLADDEGFPFLRFGKDVVPGWAESGKAAQKPKGWGYMYVLNQEGQIVFQHAHSPRFQYFRTRIVLDRLLDPEFDAGFRKGFPDEPATLPLLREEEDGKVFADDFESYPDTYGFRLRPRWGFRKHKALTGGEIEAKAGRDGSRAAVVTDTSFLRNKRHNLEHAFSQPLTSGSLTFHIRRGPAGRSKGKPQVVLQSMFYGTEGKALGKLTARGKWCGEAFAIDDEPSAVMLSESDWHEVEVKVEQGAKAKVLVDGEAVGELPAGPLTAFGLNCGHHGFYLDDVALCYGK